MNSSEEDDNFSEQDCCGSGCNPCILDVRKRLSEKKELLPNKNALNQSNYVKFIINNIKEEAEEYLMVTLNLKDPVNEDHGIILRIGQYIIMRISNISRSYTPIFWNNESFTLLIKIYKNGKMSDLIKNSSISDVVDVRGPYGEFSYQQNSYQKIIMFSIGSGIAVMYPIINSIIFNDSEDTRVYLVSSFRYFLTVPFKEELRSLSDYWNFSCTVFLTQEKNNNILSGVKIIHNAKLNGDSITTYLKTVQRESTLILICGTKEFNEMAKTTVEKCNFTNHYVFE